LSRVPCSQGKAPVYFVLNMKFNLSLAGVILSVMAGVLIGLGSYTFVYAKGFSYLSTAPEACANCHVMRQEYDGWQKSSHHNVAVCADCHIPHSFFGKYWVKAENGFMHSMKFTLQNFHEPIMLRDVSKRILNKACLHCHDALAGHIAAQDKAGDKEETCIRCHSGVGH
jgi:cytochrome c nitrite reductase small subunit